MCHKQNLHKNYTKRLIDFGNMPKTVKLLFKCLYIICFILLYILFFLFILIYTDNDYILYELLDRTQPDFSYVLETSPELPSYFEDICRLYVDKFSIKRQADIIAAFLRGDFFDSPIGISKHYLFTYVFVFINSKILPIYNVFELFVIEHCCYQSFLIRPFFKCLIFIFDLNTYTFDFFKVKLSMLATHMEQYQYIDTDDLDFSYTQDFVFERDY